MIATLNKLPDCSIWKLTLKYLSFLTCNHITYFEKFCHTCRLIFHIYYKHCVPHLYCKLWKLCKTTRITGSVIYSNILQYANLFVSGAAASSLNIYKASSKSAIKPSASSEKDNTKTTVLVKLFKSLTCIKYQNIQRVKMVNWQKYQNI